MPESTLSAGPLRAAQALDSGLVPPGVFLRGDEAIRISSFNSLAGVTLAIEGLQYIAGHGPQWFAERHTPNTDRTVNTSIVRLGEGWLSQLQVRAYSGAPRRGQCFVIVELVRGTTDANVSPLGVLVQGYVVDTQRRGWPGSPIELSTEGPGNMRVVTGTNPAANVECSDTVPTGARWRLHSWVASFVADANVANRLIGLVIDDGAANVLVTLAAAVTTASLTTIFSASDYGQLAGSAGLAIPLALPSHLILRPGFRIRTSTLLLQVGDNWGAPNLYVEEWIDG